MHPESTAVTWPMNYPVANFGMDRDMSDSLTNTKVGEGIVGHKWQWEELKKPERVLFPDASRGLDSDMLDSIANMQKVEKEKGAWDLAAV